MFSNILFFFELFIFCSFARIFWPSLPTAACLCAFNFFFSSPSKKSAPCEHLDSNQTFIQSASQSMSVQRADNESWTKPQRATRGCFRHVSSKPPRCLSEMLLDFGEHPGSVAPQCSSWGSFKHLSLVIYVLSMWIAVFSRLRVCVFG